MSEISIVDLRGLLVGAKRYAGDSSHAVRVIRPAEVPLSRLALLEGSSASPSSTSRARPSVLEQPAEAPVSYRSNSRIAIVVDKIPAALGIMAFEGGGTIPARWPGRRASGSWRSRGHLPEDEGYPLVYASDRVDLGFRGQAGRAFARLQQVRDAIARMRRGTVLGEWRPPVLPDLYEWVRRPSTGPRAPEHRLRSSWLREDPSSACPEPGSRS